MSLDRSDVERIAHLARLQIDENDIPAYTENLSSILNLIDQMQQADTGNVAPLANPLDAVQRLRKSASRKATRRC